MSKANNIKKLFGSALKELREAKNLTQEQLAEHLNLQTYQTINRIENGKSFITSELFEKMCEFFNVDPYVFFLRRGQTYTPEDLNHISQINSKLNEIYEIVRAIEK